MPNTDTQPAFFPSSARAISAESPDQPIPDLLLLTDTERQRLLVEWNDTHKDYPPDLCLHQLIEAQVERTPDAVAVISAGQQLTYRELDRRANQLAHHLQALGVGPEMLVGICVERSLEMAVGLLGILKAGGAYLPLDPTYPESRLAFMLEDAQVSVLLTQERLLPALPRRGAKVVCLDADWESVAREREENPASDVTPDNAAYLIYTSGSTGKPKGVVILHQALVNHGIAVSAQYDLRPDDRVLQFASISFDVAAEELYPSWMSGAAVVFLRDEALASLADFLRFVDEEKLTVLNLPAPYWHELVSYLSHSQAELPPTLRAMIVGSEKVLAGRFATWQDLAGERVHSWNAYGPTETTIGVTIYEPRSRREHRGTYTVPIGRPIANTQVYLLNGHLQPVPIGTPGEVYIGGVGLARGYLNRPALTAEKFIPNPFSDQPGTRLYRTGDLARYLPGGNIEFLGRIDHQVKVRGFRIEPGEIEAVLNQHPAVQEAVVLARGDVPGDTRLVAYVVSNRERQFAIGALRHLLKEKLPGYMVPSAFVALDKLPLTASGKVDRRALPAPDYAALELGEPFLAPRTPVEKVLAGIWCQLLGLERVGVNDNFFELGGHSLLATQLVARIRQALQVELPVFGVFHTPTVAGLAQSIVQARRVERRTEFPPIQPVSRDGPLPLSFPQEAIWFLNQLAPGNLAYNTQMAIWFNGRLNIAALEQTFTELVRRHEVLRTSFPTVDGEPVQIIHPPQAMTIPVIEIGALPKSQRELEVERLIFEQCQHSFDITQPPLMRWTLLRLGEEEHVLVIVEHHFVHDGWSLALLLREMKSIYEAFSTAKSSPLPDPSVQFADFAVWQRRLVEGEFLDDQLAYWKEKLAHPSRLELPSDRPRPKVHSFQGRTQLAKLPPDLYRALRSLGRREGVTLFVTMLAAFKVLLYRYTEQEDVLVGSGIANRRLREAEGLIGMIINTLVLRTDLSGNPTFRTLLRRVRETALEAYANQDIPFEKLVKELQPGRDIDRNPLFQVMFGFHDSQVPHLTLPGLTGTIQYLHNNSAKFDLSLIVIPRGEQCVGLKPDVEDESILVEWEYSTDLFDAKTIARMVEHYQTLLESVVKDPGQKIADLPLLTDTERQRLLVEWNDTHKDYPPDLCLHQLIEAQVERTPDAVAVISAGQQLTYRELDRRANQLAHHLQALGVGPEMLVGICVERSLEMAVGLLGILKAGGAYLPLDPAYPESRSAFMLEDAQVSVLLTQERLLPALPRRGAKVVCLDADWEIVAGEREESPVSGVTPGNAAYLIYTSGSTGKPKGVFIEHGQIVNYLHGILERLDLAPNAHFATVSTLAADLGNTALFSSLCTGGHLHILSHEVVSDAHAFGDYLQRQPVDCIKIVPSHLAALQAPRPECVLPRRLLILGGEASRSDWVEQLQTLAPGCVILNHYGPTEAAVGVLTYRARKEQRSETPTLPIGRPLSNTQIYLLDSQLNPVPIGVPGELHIGGAGLARGYLNRPALTAEKFIPNPFSDQPGTRLYRTGDLARYLPDGNIEFLGRADDQIKIRGFRVELGEIETTLEQHPDVQETVVLAQENTPGNKRLVAYVVPQQERAPILGGRQRYPLPNNLAVIRLNKHETDYMYKEIFELQAYLRHGITLNDGDCVFDVGANIGLFMLFVEQMCQNTRLYAFEPNPSVFEILSANAALCGADVKLFDCGLSDETKTATFTFFPGFSLLSGFYADAQTEKQVVKTFMVNQERMGVAGMDALVEQADEILEERFAAKAFTAQLRTLSSVIAEEAIERVDLLKINVEKSELDVLAGIEENDWEKIQQIVLEVDVLENLGTIVALLERHGYEVAYEQDVLLAGTPLCYIYAIRPSQERRLMREQPAGAHIRPLPTLDKPLLSSGELRRFVGERLPDHMVPTTFVFLETLPLTPNGKIDRRALPAPDQARPELEEAFVAPRTPVEEVVAGIWVQLLDIERVGIRDNFFDLGGHSLLATRLAAHLRDIFQVDIPLHLFFRAPHVAGLTAILLQDPAQRERVEKTAQMMLRLKKLSDDEVNAMLTEKTLSSREHQVQ